jgi:mannose-6-phosphate isomerase-like protein (cupin superfamily)
MIRKLHDLPAQVRENIRGGHGRAFARDYLAAGDMAGVLSLGVVPLEPGTSIGEHPHTDNEDLYYIVSGSGTGSLDGAAFPVGPGDAWVARAGHTHGLHNDSPEPLVFLGLLTQVGAVKAR